MGSGRRRNHLGGRGWVLLLLTVLGVGIRAEEVSDGALPVSVRLLTKSMFDATSPNAPANPSYTVFHLEDACRLPTVCSVCNRSSNSDLLELDTAASTIPFSMLTILQCITVFGLDRCAWTVSDSVFVNSDVYHPTTGGGDADSEFVDVQLVMPRECSCSICGPAPVTSLALESATVTVDWQAINFKFQSAPDRGGFALGQEFDAESMLDDAFLADGGEPPFVASFTDNLTLRVQLGWNHRVEDVERIRLRSVSALNFRDAVGFSNSVPLVKPPQTVPVQVLFTTPNVPLNPCLQDYVSVLDSLGDGRKALELTYDVTPRLRNTPVPLRPTDYARFLLDAKRMLLPGVVYTLTVTARNWMGSTDTASFVFETSSPDRCLSCSSADEPDESRQCALCEAGWSGPDCNTQGNQCPGSPCGEGQPCMIEPGTENSPNPVFLCGGQQCTSQPCKNGGQCLQGVESFECVCPLGFTGPTCEIFADSCSSSPCQNGGTCVDETDGFRCICPFSFNGPLCAPSIRPSPLSGEVIVDVVLRVRNSLSTKFNAPALDRAVRRMFSQTVRDIHVMVERYELVSSGQPGSSRRLMQTTVFVHDVYFYVTAPLLSGEFIEARLRETVADGSLKSSMILEGFPANVEVEWPGDGPVSRFNAFDGVACVLGDWGLPQACNCAIGTSTTSRPIITPPRFGGEACGPTTRVVPCDCSDDDGPDEGVVAVIVVASVIGFLFIVALIWHVSSSQQGPNPLKKLPTPDAEGVVELTSMGSAAELEADKIEVEFVRKTPSSYPKAPERGTMRYSGRASRRLITDAAPQEPIQTVAFQFGKLDYASEKEEESDYPGAEGDNGKEEIVDFDEFLYQNDPRVISPPRAAAAAWSSPLSSPRASPSPVRWNNKGASSSPRASPSPVRWTNKRVVSPRTASSPSGRRAAASSSSPPAVQWSNPLGDM